MTALELGTFLLEEGALVAGLCLGRAVCLRHLAPDTVPVAVRSRIERGTRLAPMILAIAVAAMAVGSTISLFAS